MSDPGSYAGWSASPSGEPYSIDPLAALQSFFKEMKKPQRYRGPMFFVHCDEWAKAVRGEPFVCAGVLCRLQDGMPVPISPLDAKEAP